MKRRHQCCWLDNNGTRCRRAGKWDDVFQRESHGDGWYVVYTCEYHSTTPAERKRGRDA